MEGNGSGHRQLAVRIAEVATDAERLALRDWAIALLEIKASQVPAARKAQQAIALTHRSKVVWPVVKMLGRDIKRLGWEERSLAGRLGMGGAAVGLAAFGGHGAGIAALGTAIGVPLWVVVGSGAAFAGVLIEELTGKRKPVATTSYTVLDAKNE